MAKFSQHKEAVTFLTTTDASLKLLREERMHIVPIITKYSGSSGANTNLIEQL